MDLETGYQYHVYNRGINRASIFFSNKNYVYFRQKLIDYLKPHISIISNCLMPNHFHLHLAAGDNFNLLQFQKAMKIILSSYSRAVNLKYGRVGSLFQQHTKAKCLSDDKHQKDLPFICFNYLHQNPLKAGLVGKLEDWEFSSFNEYFNNNPLLCDVSLGRDLLNLPTITDDFYKMSLEQFDNDLIKKCSKIHVQPDW